MPLGDFGIGFVISLLQFCLYPLAVAFSNDHVESERRVSLTAMLLVTYGVGACIGPLAAGVLMKVLWRADAVCLCLQPGHEYGADRFVHG